MARRRDDLKGKRERKYNLGDLPDLAREQRREIPRQPVGNFPPGGASYDPAQGIVSSAGEGLAGPGTPRPDLSVTSIYEGRPIRALDFLVWMDISAGGV